MYDPALQSSLQNVLPTVGAYFPLAQTLQQDTEVCSFKSLYLPIPQELQAAVPLE